MDTKDCSGVHPPSLLSFQTVIISCLLCPITVFGNTLVILAVIKDPTRRLRTPFNFFICNIAIADALVGYLLDPISIYVHSMEGLKEPFSLVPLHVVYFIGCTSSVFGITALTVDRYLAVTSPLTYRFKLSSKRTINWSVLIWVMSISLSMIYFQIGYIDYSFVFVNISVITTFLFLVFVYVKIYVVLKKQAEHLDKHEGNKEAQPKSCRARKRNQRDEKVINALLVMLLAFMMCYGPSCILIYTMKWCSACSCTTIHWLRDYSFLLVLANSAVNPYLYALRIPNFKRSIMLLLRITPNAVGDDTTSFNEDDTSKRIQSKGGPYVIYTAACPVNGNGDVLQPESRVASSVQVNVGHT